MTAEGEECIVLERQANETYEDYFVRLHDNKANYGLTHRQIAALLNADTGQNYGESAYRKEARAFERGRQYERKQHAPPRVATRILALSDFHIPYQVPVETFSSYYGQVDVLVLNGDIEDCQSCSSFPKKYRVPFMEELIQTREYLIRLIRSIHPRTVYFTRGNHEDRLLRYLSDKVSEDLLTLMPDSPLDLLIHMGFRNTDRGNGRVEQYASLQEVLEDEVELIYTGDWKCKVGHTIFAHPLAYSSAMLKTTEKAVNYFLRTDRDFDSIVLAHTHKLGYYLQGGIAMYEQGCCCRTDMLNYADGHLTLPQQNGFLYLSQDADGHILLDETKLIHF